MTKYLIKQLSVVVLLFILAGCSSHYVAFVAGSATGAFLSSQAKNMFK